MIIRLLVYNLILFLLFTAPVWAAYNLRSIESRFRTELEFNNRLSAPVAIYWVNQSGNEIFYKDLNPGAIAVMQTFATHPWVVRDKRTGQVLQTIVAGYSREIVSIVHNPTPVQKGPAPVQRPAQRLTPQVQAPQLFPSPTKRQPEPAVPTMGQMVQQAIFVLVIIGFIVLLICLARSSSIFVLGHWSKLIENLQASPKEFYASVENAIAKREVPAIKKSRVDWKEGGLFTAWREYLRISREKEVVDICGAPYGTGFFVSWWHGELQPSAVLSTLAAIALAVAVDIGIGFLLPRNSGIFVRLMAVATALILIFLFVGILVNRSAGQNWVRYVLAIPVIGWLIDRWFLPPTYYRLDSASMFQAAVNQAVQEVIDQMATAKGLRTLTELERKPILRDFFQRMR